MIERMIVSIAGMESNAFGWQSIIAGYVSVYSYDGKIKDEEVYVRDIVEYFELLDFDMITSDNEIKHTDLESIRDFCIAASKCDLAKLEVLAREDWKYLIDEINESV